VSQNIPYEEYDEEIAADKVERAKKIFSEVKRTCRKPKVKES
jgi:HEPN domain-containing protein